MQQSCKVTAQMIKDLRDRSGAPMPACKDALVKCEGDELLAEGWLKYYGCAINTSEPHEDWAMRNARSYKERVLADPTERTPHHINSL